MPFLNPDLILWTQHFFVLDVWIAKLSLGYPIWRAGHRYSKSTREQWTVKEIFDLSFLLVSALTQLVMDPSDYLSRTVTTWYCAFIIRHKYTLYINCVPLLVLLSFTSSDGFFFQLRSGHQKCMHWSWHVCYPGTQEDSYRERLPWCCK